MNVAAKAAATSHLKKGQAPGWAETHMQWANVRATAAAPGRPKQGQPPRGAESHTQWANVGALLPG